MLENDHRRYVELCALATSDTLSVDEREDLQRHAANCANCRSLLEEYLGIAREGMSLLAATHGAAGLSHTGAWMNEETRNRLATRLREEMREVRQSDLPLRLLEQERPIEPASDRLLRSVSPPGLHVLAGTGSRHSLRKLLLYAAAALVVLGVSASSYRLGTRRAGQQDANAVRGEMQGLSRERDSLNERLVTRTIAFDELSNRLNRQTEELARLKVAERNALQENAEDKANQRQRMAELEALRARGAFTENERDALHRKLQEAESALAATQSDLEELRQQRAGDLVASANLESRIEQLSKELKEREQTLQRQQQFLASDRDIRELMGARDLYIADVFDVDRNGKTQQPFGRVFYTKGKSLIFYAYDLDRLQKARNVNTFQAWGLRGADSKVPLNLGILYLDNETNKRWVLRFDDSKALAEINAVFVTLEPKGGSQRPSGKQLLYAYLRSTPNHP